MPQTTTTLTLENSAFKGSITFNNGLFINGQFVDPLKGGSIDVFNPTNGELVASVAEGTKEDIDLAVEAARNAYKTSWGLKVPGSERGKLLYKLAELVEKHIDELAVLDTLNVGKPFALIQKFDAAASIGALRYYAGWADKIHGQTIETNEMKLTYTRHEPFGVVGQIVPWNVPFCAIFFKIAPALATGNTIVLKPSEVTPLSAQLVAQLIVEAGFPPGVVNIVNGYGNTAGQAIAEHKHIRKVAFTGSTATGRKIQEASAKSNLKSVSLELGGKSPSIIFEDADLPQAVQWASRAVFPLAGQMCTAGSRILVQEGIYDQFVEAFIGIAKFWTTTKGDPFEMTTLHSPQVSEIQMKRVLEYFDIAKKEGAQIMTGGTRIGDIGYFIEPTVISANNDMRIAREEIFGPVACIIKFKTEEEALEIANDTEYGLAAGVFTENSGRAIRMAHALEAGMAFVNSYNTIETNVPFGGYKQSGIGRENGEYALSMYTQVKAVHVNLGIKL